MRYHLHISNKTSSARRQCVHVSWWDPVVFHRCISYPAAVVASKLLLRDIDVDRLTPAEGVYTVEAKNAPPPEDRVLEWDRERTGRGDEMAVADCCRPRSSSTSSAVPPLANWL